MESAGGRPGKTSELAPRFSIGVGADWLWKLYPSAWALNPRYSPHAEEKRQSKGLTQGRARHRLRAG